MRHGKFYWWLKWLYWSVEGRLKHTLTGDCGFLCEDAWFKKLDGTPVKFFVPEAGCPIHDK